MILRQDRPTLASVSGIGFLIDGINAVATGSLWRSQPDGDIGSPLPRCPMRLLFTSIRSALGSLLPQQPRSAQILAADRGSRGIRDQPQNPPKYTEKRIRINFPFPCPSRGRAHARRVGSPARRVGSFRGYPFVMIFLAWVIDALHADGVSGVGELDVGP